MRSASDLCGRLKTPAIGLSLAARIGPPPRTVLVRLLNDTNKKKDTPPNWRRPVFTTQQRSGEHTHTQPNFNVVWEFVTHLTCWFRRRTRTGHTQHFFSNTKTINTLRKHNISNYKKKLATSLPTWSHTLTHTLTHTARHLPVKKTRTRTLDDKFEIFFFSKTYFPHRYTEIYSRVHSYGEWSPPWCKTAANIGC